MYLIRKLCLRTARKARAQHFIQVPDTALLSDTCPGLLLGAGYKIQAPSAGRHITCIAPQIFTFLSECSHRIKKVFSHVFCLSTSVEHLRAPARSGPAPVTTFTSLQINNHTDMAFIFLCD